MTIQVWLDEQDQKMENHTRSATLKFNGKTIWGPRSCHDSVSQLSKAISEADPRFTLENSASARMHVRHIRCISVKNDDKVILDKLSCQGDMRGLVEAIEKVLAEDK
ncbi:hypothetical protein Dda_3277 [Drechslerella dactyloides]|uniref:Uncharacterized protein n=1 Tax=Drechslerella dactyloides TaxID=74499 RepID=A0AAD6J110_DREDA|nr:hypothetical protein Dda_3277 [Drechslerella dactyloides]